MKRATVYPHRRAIRPILPSTVIVAAVVLGFAGLGDSINLLAQGDVENASFQPTTDTAIHETRSEPLDALQVPNPNEAAATIEPFLPAPSTRSSFMASWDVVMGAAGYLLDVSTSPAFDSFVDGYHDLDVGNIAGSVVTSLSPGTTYYYRVRAYDATEIHGYSRVMTGATVPSTGLIIHATFDNSITSRPNAAAIEGMINRAIARLETLFGDPITIQIRFRFSTTAPDGTHLSPGTLALSFSTIYTAIPWNTYINALRANATTSNDNLANASLPPTALSPHIVVSSPNGRAVGLNTPPAMFANGRVGPGGPYDGIITLNSAVSYQFSRPTTGGNFDAQRTTEHEMDEVMGLGSRLGSPGNDLRPQDLFTWASAGHRNITSSGLRYFSINGGSTHIVNFNQNPTGDFGDWSSTACPQTHPFVQNAFSCLGQSSDVTRTSPEGVNLDVIGYDLH